MNENLKENINKTIPEEIAGLEEIRKQMNSNCEANNKKGINSLEMHLDVKSLKLQKMQIKEADEQMERIKEDVKRIDSYISSLEDTNARNIERFTRLLGFEREKKIKLANERLVLNKIKEILNINEKDDKRLNYAKDVISLNEDDEENKETEKWMVDKPKTEIKKRKKKTIP